MVNAYKKRRYGFRSVTHQWMSETSVRLIEQLREGGREEIRNVLDVGTGAGEYFISFDSVVLMASRTGFVLGAPRWPEVTASL